MGFIKKSMAVAATCSMAISVSAVAQENTAPTETATSDGEQSGALAEVVVTAQKRAESAQRAPVAITAIGSQDLVAQGVDNLMAAEVLLPSAKLNIETNAVQVFIRGVGSQLDYTWIPESVAVNLNGENLSRFSAAGALYDIQRIEVLPGPQGTLYGRAAIGGAVNIITNRPTPYLTTDALVEYGDYDTKHVTLVQNVPISSDWSLRGAVDYLDNEGYDNNGSYSTDSTSVRLSSLYSGTDFTAFLSGSYYSNRYRPPPVQYWPAARNNPWSFPANDASSAYFYPPNGLSNSYGHAWDETSNFSGELDWNLGPVTVAYIPGAVRTAHWDDRVAAGFVLVTPLDVDQFSNELRFSGSNADNFNWVGGVYQFWQKSFQNQTFGPNLAGGAIKTHQKSYAVYGQGTYSVTSRARLTLGGRLSEDQISADDSAAIYPIAPGPDFGRGTLPFTYSNSWKKGGWKVGGEYDLSPDSLLYANIQTGFNPGSFNASAPIQGSEIHPQTMLGYTAGVKNQFWNGRARLNLEGFLYDYKGLIVQAINLQTGFQTFLNAPRSRITGAQLDFVIAPIDDLKLHATYGYLHAIFTEFVAGAASGTGSQNYAGYQLPYAATNTASVGAEYTIHLGNAGSLGLRADSYISSAYWGIFNHSASLLQDAYTKTDTSLTYYAPSGLWDLGIYGKNLENVAVAAAGATTGQPYPYAGGFYFGPPRTYGIRFHLTVGGK